MARVVLIEDEPNIAEAIRFLLVRDGCEVLALPDGLGGVAAIAAGRPDIVILDLMLPGVSGLDLLAAIRADAGLAAVPVLMLTAKGQGRDREAAERAGVSRFMTKPFANAEMLAAVRDLVGQGRERGHDQGHDQGQGGGRP
ncbi:response regulator transcription factor [Paragemmobacter straminiformis]|uniref:Response regulator n=1 Tax=Paragemmobacter straminiformis TaxID=2045119 RepID=A0A842I6C0_9RHOB|nr:response regulator [Gemmobacter straminiformis]MBC2835199.1 response regulator [Gemmobacter straminiformis]